MIYHLFVFVVFFALLSSWFPISLFWVFSLFLVLLSFFILSFVFLLPSLLFLFSSPSCSSPFQFFCWGGGGSCLLLCFICFHLVCLLLPFSALHLPILFLPLFDLLWKRVWHFWRRVFWVLFYWKMRNGKHIVQEIAAHPYIYIYVL